MRSVIAAASIGSTTKPFSPSRTRSAEPAFRETTTFAPAISASPVTAPYASCVLGRTRMSMRLYQASNSSPESCPVNKASGAIASRASRRGPSPMMTSCARSFSGSKARMRVGMFFNPTRRPTNATTGFSPGRSRSDSGSTRSSSGRTRRSSAMMGIRMPFPKRARYHWRTASVLTTRLSSQRGTNCRARRWARPKSWPWIMSRPSSQMETTRILYRFRSCRSRRAMKENSWTKTTDGREEATSASRPFGNTFPNRWPVGRR